jgi:hypothetical protein
MKAYEDITDKNNGQLFPDTRAIDSSGPLATDGTEIIKEVVDDIWLERQALLDFYNNPPNGLDDLPGVDVISGLPNSQPLATQYMAHATPGVIINWPSAEDPFAVGVTHGIDIRLLLLEGQGIDRTLDDYKMLDSIVYIGDTDNPSADSFYHADDAAGTIRNIAGDYLILPDLRGYSIRGLDITGTVDPDGASRIVGSVQEDAFQDFTGSFFLKRKNLGNPEIVLGNPSGAFVVNPAIEPLGAENSEIQATTPSGPNNKEVNEVLFFASGDSNARTSIETRNKNMAAYFAIYY